MAPVVARLKGFRREQQFGEGLDDSLNVTRAP